MDASLTGSGQHKFRSINVEANLLDTWIDQRNDLEQKIRQRLLVVLLLCGASAIVIPALSSLHSGKTLDAKKAHRELVLANKKCEELEVKAKTLTPGIQFDTMTASCKKNSLRLLSEVAQVVNAAPLDVVFSTMKVDVLSGDVTLKITADAKTSESGRSFIEVAGKGEDVLDSLQTAVRSSKSFGEQGVTFDYIKRVRLDHD